MTTKSTSKTAPKSSNPTEVEDIKRDENETRASRTNEDATETKDGIVDTSEKVIAYHNRRSKPNTNDGNRFIPKDQDKWRFGIFPMAECPPEWPWEYLTWDEVPESYTSKNVAGKVNEVGNLIVEARDGIWCKALVSELKEHRKGMQLAPRVIKENLYKKSRKLTIQTLDGTTYSPEDYLDHKDEIEAELTQPKDGVKSDIPLEGEDMDASIDVTAGKVKV